MNSKFIFTYKKKTKEHCWRLPSCFIFKSKLCYISISAVQQPNFPRIWHQKSNDLKFLTWHLLLYLLISKHKIDRFEDKHSRSEAQPVHTDSQWYELNFKDPIRRIRLNLTFFFCDPKANRSVTWPSVRSKTMRFC